MLTLVDVWRWVRYEARGTKRVVRSTPTAAAALVLVCETLSNVAAYPGTKVVNEAQDRLKWKKFT